MKLPLLLLLACLSILPLRADDAANNELAQEEKAAGWKLLFDGEDANPWWRGYKKDDLPAGWKVIDGALVRKGPGGDIITRDQFESFELSIDWKISSGGNSGVMFKVKETADKPAWTGPEAQILDNILGRDPQKAGWLYDLYPAEIDTTKPVGQWNNFILRCQKTAAGTFECEHWMNGVKYIDYEIGSNDWHTRVAKSKFADKPGFAKADAGHICLQDHGDEVSFRNIKIRVLPSKEEEEQQNKK
jgi:hypothetical protein